MPEGGFDPAPSVPAFTSRPAEPDDESFLLRLYGTTREKELALLDWPDEEKQKFVRHQFEAQRTHYETHFPDADHRVLLVEGEPIGRVWTDRRDDEIRVLDLAILPQHRGVGIGSVVLRRHQAEAATAGLPLTVCVEINNPRAKQLYLRLGFTVVKDLQSHELLEWIPPEGV